ncbi:LysR family transcriptional regulator [Vibrio breoganii]|uniref:LysR family transcriptional regulator n=1 Tax=Vibrio breoganii TaxID=553239 RepID=A0AAP8SVT4_9VIBR|nr:LysR family transcriptional regulator [Vibrio breoganii]NMO74413.1 LysR family transcriptional regulator [Vibrio breoganii]NMR71158.1 LysR family transcriptional regulator [Vibrio breoganii]OED96607.1 LysR family transcriptional regulator [Vibrio breoganii ZF-29]OEF83631.1 LysR family transcriptional regulator [Vibrio breoganii 1C10]PMF97329.1 LysR family transcriptional regulator [Vibrio breoganii]
MAEINWKGVDLNLLVAFQALLRARSVSAAASELHISQSAMSHSLSRLRTLLGDPLFHRSGHKMEPTERALNLGSDVEQVLSVIKNNILSPEKFDAETFSGTCRLGLTDYAEFVFAPLIFDALTEQAPNVKVSFINVNRHNFVDIIEKERLDLVIGSFPELGEGFESQELYKESHVCLFDPIATGLSTPVSLEDFCSLPHALVSPDGRWVTPTDNALAKQNHQRNVQVISRNFLTIGQLIKGRNLICIVPKLMSMIPYISDGLTRAKPAIEVSDFTISMVWKSGLASNDKQQWLQSRVATAVQNNQLKENKQ